MQRSDISGKTILITGGAGFIGSWLCESLLTKGNRIICIDNLITGSKNNINHLLSNNNFNFIEKDVSEKLNIEDKLDIIFHLASPASPKDFEKIPIEIMFSNSIGLYNLLVLAKEKNARFLFASTSETYGQPQEHPQKEEYWGNVNPVGQRSCYDESKRFGEALSMTFHRIYGLDVKIARIFNTYGPRMRRDDGRVTPNFIIQALNNNPITIHGDGKQTRSFCYVADMVEGLEKLLCSGYSGHVFNLGNTDEISILKLADKIKEITASSSGIIFKPLPEDDPLRRKPDITKAKEFLKWEPKTTLEDGLKKTVEWFRVE
jgi:nucleoside-diphosphate-sugar epimerase